jgi:hypothetical protein
VATIRSKSSGTAEESALSNDPIDGLPEVRQQSVTVGTGHHEAGVVLRLPNVEVALGEHVLLATEELDLLPERQLSVGNPGH